MTTSSTFASTSRRIRRHRPAAREAQAGVPHAPVTTRPSRRTPAAKLSATYAQWPYRALLESRLANAAANVEAFRVEPREQPVLDKKFVTGSAFTCTVCHQKDGVGAL
ncbi:MAG: hypothetical protein Q8L14_12470 [Myxococcales bacterium]|nr:hypothetical protein [Myxococcales bacterium]